MFILLGFSALMSLATVSLNHFSQDDLDWLYMAVGSKVCGGHPLTIYSHGAGFIQILRCLYPFFENHVLAYRSLSLAIGLGAFGIMAWIVRESELAVFALAGLLWTPIQFSVFREIRYDSFMLLVVAVNLLWLTQEEDSIWVIVAGFLCGMIPCVVLSGVLITATMFLMVLMRCRRLDAWLWLVWFAVGFALFSSWVHIPQSIAEIKTFHYMVVPGGIPHGRQGFTPAILFLKHPFILLKEFFNRLFRGFGGLFDPMAWIFYGILFIRIVLNLENVLCRFALAFILVNFFLSASTYPSLIYPVMIVAGIP